MSSFTETGTCAVQLRQSAEIQIENGITLFCEEFGQHDDPAVLLVMGNSAPGLVWPDAFCEMLASYGYRVIRFDQRDTGLPSYIDFGQDPYTLHHLVLHAFQLMDALQVKRFHVAGLSQGGVLACMMAISRPDRLLSLVTLMSSPDLRPKNDAFANLPKREGELPRPAAAYIAEVIALNAQPAEGMEAAARRFVDNFPWVSRVIHSMRPSGWNLSKPWHGIP